MASRKRDQTPQRMIEVRVHTHLQQNKWQLTGYKRAIEAAQSWRNLTTIASRYSITQDRLREPGYDVASVERDTVGLDHVAKANRVAVRIEVKG